MIDYALKGKTFKNIDILLSNISLVQGVKHILFSKIMIEIYLNIFFFRYPLFSHFYFYFLKPSASLRPLFGSRLLFYDITVKRTTLPNYVTTKK